MHKALYKSFISIICRMHTIYKFTVNGLTDSCILCSQNMLALIGSVDWNRLPTAEWERHYLQNGRENQNTECKCIDCMHATDDCYKCPTKYLVQTTVAPPS